MFVFNGGARILIKGVQNLKKQTHELVKGGSISIIYT